MGVRREVKISHNKRTAAEHRKRKIVHLNAIKKENWLAINWLGGKVVVGVCLCFIEFENFAFLVHLFKTHCAGFS